MSNNKPRQTNIAIEYSGKNLARKITAYLENFSYIDAASGESDRIDITVSNRNKKWFSAWCPKKGDTLKAKIQQKNWQNFKGKKKNITTNCGSFVLDDVSYSGRPLVCKMSATSVPQNEAFNSNQITKTWEKTSLKMIAQTISGSANIALHYEGEDIAIEAIEQNNQTDCTFLYGLCNNYGMAMKVFNNKICIFDEEIYENKKAVTTLYEKNMIDWDYNTTIAGTYTGANFDFTDPTDDAEYSITIGGGSRIKSINVTANNLGEAEKKGIAILHNENKKATTMNITIPADPRIYAGAVITVKGLGNLNGRYYVEKVRHRVGSAYNMSLSVRLVQKRIKSVSINAVEDAKAAEAAAGTPYTIKSGDTLWALAVQFYGSGVKYVEIYNTNKEIIESTAKARGKGSSQNGHWIFPGTVITIPASAG